jgi:hypothetical protein
MRYDFDCKECKSDDTEIFSFIYGQKEYICVRCLNCHSEWILLIKNMEYDEMEY